MTCLVDNASGRSGWELTAEAAFTTHSVGEAWNDGCPPRRVPLTPIFHIAP